MVMQKLHHDVMVREHLLQDLRWRAAAELWAGQAVPALLHCRCPPAAHLLLLPLHDQIMFLYLHFASCMLQLGLGGTARAGIELHC